MKIKTIILLCAVLALCGVLLGVVVLGYQDLQIISTPGNPASGYMRLFASGSQLGCLTSSGANCLSSAGPSIPSNCALVSSNSTPALACQTAKGLASVAYAAGGGTANLQTVSYSPAVAALADIQGYPVCWLPSNANSSTTPTLAVNGLIAKTLTKTGTAALAANDLTTTAVACAIYDGTEFQLQNPQTAGGTSTTFQVNGTNLTSASTVNFQSGTNVTVTNPSAGVVNIAASAGSGAMTQLGQCTAGISNWTCTGSGSSPGSLASVNFTSIAGSYNQLQMYVTGGTGTSADLDFLQVQFNTDTSAHYAAQGFKVLGGSVTANPNSTSATSGLIGVIGAASAASGDVGSLVLNIPGYTLSLSKNYTSMSSAPSANPGVNGRATYMTGGFWSGTAAITAINVAPNSGSSFTQNTVVTLYGIN